MQLNPHSWHVKWYFFATALFEAWKGNEPPMFFTTPVETNLCPYMRRILWTFPWLLFFYASVIFLTVNAALYYPLTHFGLGYVEMIAAVAAGSAVFSFIIWGICKICPGIVWFWITYIYNPLCNIAERVVAATEDCIMGKPDAPSFCAVLRQWFIDGHHHICRNITIGG